jgi:dTDP-4-amino-4,6-dideoxygalactose transaminase
VKGLRCLEDSGETVSNYAYFPVLVDKEYPIDRDALYERLKAHDVFARRYFYPLISSFPMYRGLSSSGPSNLPVATDAASRVLCLPIYPDLALDEQLRIIDLIRSV